MIQETDNSTLNSTKFEQIKISMKANLSLSIVQFFCFYFLSFPIWWCDNKIGDHPQEDLAKFGHLQDLKV
jgi:hypothetical protein